MVEKNSEIIVYSICARKLYIAISGQPKIHISDIPVFMSDPKVTAVICHGVSVCYSMNNWEVNSRMWH